MDVPAILDKINTPLQFATMALFVLIYGLVKIRSNKRFLWLCMFAGIAFAGGLWLDYLEKSPSTPASVTVTNTGQGGAAVGTNEGTINIGSGNGK